MKKLILITVLLTGFLVKAQDSTLVVKTTFTLEEAVGFGLNNGYNSRISDKDVAIALKQKWEIISQGLPQISANGSYTNNLIQPITLIPAVFNGGPPGSFIPVTFGTKQAVNANVVWNQLIFDGSYIVGVQSAKTLLQISENSNVKTNLEVKKAITDAYGNVLLARESIAILKGNLAILEKNLDDTQKIYDNGLVEEEDVEQLKITFLGLEANLNNALRIEEIAYDMLKVTMGIPVDSEIVAIDNLNDLSLENFDLLLLDTQINVEENIDYRLAEDQKNLAEVEVKLEKSKALPRLTGFLNFGYSGNSDEFTFFNREQEYFDQSILGLQLTVPIFSSGMRSAKTAQKQLAFEQSLLRLEQTRNQIKLQIENAKSEYQFAIENYGNKKQSLALAERIENKNRIKFTEGISSSFELSEAQQQLYQAQQQYLQTMLDVITKKTALENLLDTTKYNSDNNPNQK